MPIEPIEVIYKPAETCISLVINGECDHADNDIVQIDVGGLQYVNGELDWEENYQPALECTKCRAWRHSWDDEWFGVTNMPKIIPDRKFCGRITEIVTNEFRGGLQ